VEAALSASNSAWSLIVACDLPLLHVKHLCKLLKKSEKSTADAVISMSPAGQESVSSPAIQPLCGVYRSGLADAIHAHFQELKSLPEAERKSAVSMRAFLSGIHWETVVCDDPRVLLNVNTPEQLRLARSFEDRRQ
jgi:molybdopterin-guanine dinucleotide biosynthesis protein A